MNLEELKQYCKSYVTIETISDSNFNNELILKCKNGNKIHIKKENRGKFTKYCNGKVTDECIKRGKNSPDPRVRKMSTFAANSRRWNR